METIYHLLDEQEVFSEQDGGAISRWAANVLSDGAEVVICPAFDSSWNFPAERIYMLPHWHLTDPIHPVLYRLPWILQKGAYSYVFRGLLEKLKEGDILYVHNRPEAAATLAIIAPRIGFRVILHMHNSHLIRANKGQHEALRNTPIVFCSDFLRKQVNAALPNHFSDTHVVYNGADHRQYRSVQRPRSVSPLAIFTGRLVPYKGVHVLLEAMRILDKRQIDIRCQIVGAAGFGRSRSTWYSRSLLRRKPQNTEFLGYKSGKALADLLRSADIFCCPSIWNDPFPLAPLEAMATGLPVVASQTGGLPEMFAHGGGVLVPPDDADALADALEKLGQDISCREQMGKQAFASFNAHFRWSNVREQYEQVVRGVSREVFTSKRAG